MKKKKKIIIIIKKTTKKKPYIIVVWKHLRNNFAFSDPMRERFWKHWTKWRNCRTLVLYSFPSAFSIVWKTEVVLTHYQTAKLYTGPHTKMLQTTNQIWLQPYNLSQNGKKTLWKKKRMLVTSIFFFSHNIFGGHNASYQNFLLFP